MKNLFKSLLTISIAAVIVSCGGGNDAESKKAQLEKLKAEQSELSSKIKALEEEIASAGITIDTKEKIVNVSVSKVSLSSFRHFIDVQGHVDGDENTNISAKVPGVVTKVMVRPGSVVKAGQVIAQLDGDAIYKQIQAMEVNLNLVTDLYQKQKALWEKQVGSEIQFKQAKANKESLEQQLASMKEQYEMYQIKSPVDGTIDVVNLKIGQTAAPGFPYFSIVNFNKLKVKADVAENYANKVKQGNDVEIEFPDINKTINSTIAYSGKGISALNRTFSIEVNLPQDESYLPNMIAVVKIIDYRKDNAIVVPVNCIQTSDGNAHVFVVSKEKGKNVARKKFVKMGMTYNDKAEILEGLNPGDELVTVGYSDLNDGETIKF